MVRGDALYQQFVAILKEELRPAMGCTEPIAIAYAAAKARQVLGEKPQRKGREQFTAKSSKGAPSARPTRDTRPARETRPAKPQQKRFHKPTK